MGFDPFTARPCTYVLIARKLEEKLFFVWRMTWHCESCLHAIRHLSMTQDDAALSVNLSVDFCEIFTRDSIML